MGGNITKAIVDFAVAIDTVGERIFAATDKELEEAAQDAEESEERAHGLLHYNWFGSSPRLVCCITRGITGKCTG